MNELIFGALILPLFSCSNQNTKNVKDTRIDSVENKHVIQQNSRKDNVLDTIIYGKRLYIKDTTNYSFFFINELKSVHSEYDTLKVIDDSLFLYSRPNYKPDTLFLFKYKIPTELELNKETIYTTNYNEKEYTLVLKRTNLTNLEYVLNQGKTTVRRGLATLQGVFFFGAEGQPNEKGEPIFLRQYLDNSPCRANIKVQLENAERAVIAFCIDLKKEEYLELPIMLRK
ncbi:MAG: hypothetical protein AB9846_14110 [Tenuifilaceae bacterium]